MSIFGLILIWYMPEYFEKELPKDFFIVIFSRKKKTNIKYEEKKILN